MAMTTCSECGKEMSDSAKACPHCGARPRRLAARKAARVTALGCLTLLVAIVLLIVVASFSGGDGTVRPAPPQGGNRPAAPWPRAADAKDGTVLPFKVLRAIGNAAFADGITIDSDIVIAVTGGTPEDWAATAIAAAEKAVPDRATQTKVVVMLDNPWNNQRSPDATELAMALYVPDPKDQVSFGAWNVQVVKTAAPMPEIEFAMLQLETSQADARARVIAKYHLPSSWNPPISLAGRGFHTIENGSIRVLTPAAIAQSFAALDQCLIRPPTPGKANWGCF